MAHVEHKRPEQSASNAKAEAYMNIEGWGGRTGVKVDKKSPASQWNVKHNNSEAGFVVPAPKSSERRRMGSSASVPQLTPAQVQGQVKQDLYRILNSPSNPISERDVKRASDVMRGGGAAPRPASRADSLFADETGPDNRVGTSHSHASRSPGQRAMTPLSSRSRPGTGVPAEHRLSAGMFVETTSSKSRPSPGKPPAASGAKQLYGMTSPSATNPLKERSSFGFSPTAFRSPARAHSASSSNREEATSPFNPHQIIRMHQQTSPTKSRMFSQQSTSPGKPPRYSLEPKIADDSHRYSLSPKRNSLESRNMRVFGDHYESGLNQKVGGLSPMRRSANSRPVSVDQPRWKPARQSQDFQKGAGNPGAVTVPIGFLTSLCPSRMSVTG